VKQQQDILDKDVSTANLFTLIHPTQTSEKLSQKKKHCQGRLAGKMLDD